MNENTAEVLGRVLPFHSHEPPGDWTVINVTAMPGHTESCLALHQVHFESVVCLLRAKGHGIYTVVGSMFPEELGNILQ